MNNSDPVLFSVIRAILPTIGGFVAQSGIMANDDFLAIGGGVLSLLSVIWAWKANKGRNR